MNLFQPGFEAGQQPAALMQGVDIGVIGEGVDAPQLQPDGSLHIPLPDGGIEIDLSPDLGFDKDDDKFYANLAEKLSEEELGRIASDLMEGIQADKQSRQGWIEQISKGIDLLALKIETPRSDVGGSTAPLEGMSTLRHPMLQQAVLMFQANFRGENLPADGPVKIETYGEQTEETDEEAESLAEDMNYWFTQVATEYYPDTMRMAYQYGFQGHGVKKVYYCPLRRRPASESVAMEDFIVSNTATDLRNAERITQVIRMSKNTLRRMQLVGAYRDIDIQVPTGEQPGQIREKISRIEGVSATVQRPEDNQYEIYECYCLLDIHGFEHKQNGKITGLAVPYRVAIEANSQKILAIHRDYEPDDEDALRKDTFVDFIFVYAFGYYGMGLLHLMGNTEVAATGAWRLFIDALMFANFPGFLYLKNGARQSNNTFRVAPGSGAAIDAGAGKDIRQVLMPLPYKAPDPASIQFMDNVIQTGEKLGGISQMAVGEGQQNAPVGTTLALLEQQTKPIAVPLKNAHTSQAKEFQLLRDLFCQYPETLINGAKKNKKRRSKIQWDVDRLLNALNNYDLCPVSDPSNPTHMHRMAKAQVLQQLSQAYPQLYDPKKVNVRICNMMQVNDVESLMIDPDQVQHDGPDPKQISANADLIEAQTKATEVQQKAAIQQQKNMLDAAQMQNDQKVELLKLAREEAVHPDAIGMVHQELGLLDH